MFCAESTPEIVPLPKLLDGRVGARVGASARVEISTSWIDTLPITVLVPKPEGVPPEPELWFPLCFESEATPMGSDSGFDDLFVGGRPGTGSPSRGAWSVLSFLMPSVAYLVWTGPCQYSRNRTGLDSLGRSRFERYHHNFDCFSSSSFCFQPQEWLTYHVVTGRAQATRLSLRALSRSGAFKCLYIDDVYIRSATT